jgi:hypothetical protein
MTLDFSAQTLVLHMLFDFLDPVGVSEAIFDFSGRKTDKSQLNSMPIEKLEKYLEQCTCTSIKGLEAYPVNPTRWRT